MTYEYVEAMLKFVLSITIILIQICYYLQLLPSDLEIEFLTGREHKPRWLVHSLDKRFLVIAHWEVIENFITCISLMQLQ